MGKWWNFLFRHSMTPILHQPSFPGGSMAKIIDGLVDYMLAARRAPLPVEVVQKGKSHLLDSLAAVISGSTLKPGKLGLQHARELGGKEVCSVLGSDFKTTPIMAAFAN